MDRARWFYPDTSYIYGGFKKKARELRVKSKPRKKFKQQIRNEAQALIEKGIKFVISELTEYEIKHNLMREENLTFAQANKIFQDRIKECPIYVKIQSLKEIKISSDMLNKALQNKLDLNDALHILIATKLSLYIITKEKGNKFENWNKAYDSVLSTTQFQEQVRKLAKI